MKKIIALSAVAFLSTSLYANAEMQTQIDELTKKLAKIEKKQKKNSKKISAVNKLANKDNIKFDVDFRTSYDNIAYKTVSGEEYKNDGLYSNRLWLNMGYAPTTELMFKGTLAFNKAFGASPYRFNQDGSVSDMPQRGFGYDAFDWVVNENLTDEKLRVREAYWLWMPTIGERGYTFSVGRRPATNGFLTNLRDNDKAKSPMGHIINMEFDGASVSMKTGDIVEGSYLKLCLGRGLTNAKARFDMMGLDYATEDNNLDNMDLIGGIAKLYDDGQYTAFFKYYRAFNVIGNDMSSGTPVLASFGAMDGSALSVQVSGIGDEINDFLDETIIFASFAYSNTLPDGKKMMGSIDNESGTSIYVGVQTPNMTGGKFGLEYNEGSEYWRSFTYAEDTMIGSKMAVRGNAIEAYWSQPLIKNIFTMQVRYTQLNYDYTGSNGFFGDGGTPMKLADAQAMGMDPVETAQDLRVYFRYQY
ncbi:MAG: DUF3373 family protein [Campylobacterota bacterium]|nr:DUF3373 family protein [Campylobacterota bacterium]